MRHKDGEPYLTGTWIDARGQTQSLHAADILLTPQDTAKVAGRPMPVRWSIKIPGKQLDITARCPQPQCLDGFAHSLLGGAGAIEW